MVEALQQAGELVHRAVELLDSANAPADIGAHLDMALTRIQEETGASVDQIGSVTDMEFR